MKYKYYTIRKLNKLSRPIKILVIIKIWFHIVACCMLSVSKEQFIAEWKDTDGLNFSNISDDELDRHVTEAAKNIFLFVKNKY